MLSVTDASSRTLGAGESCASHAIARGIAICGNFAATAAALFIVSLNAESACGAGFVGERRTETDQGGRPNPYYWRDNLAPIRDGIRTLNITFNTAGVRAVPEADKPAIQAAINAWLADPVSVAPGNLKASIPDGAPTKQKDGKVYDLETLMMHELGHAFGLTHPNLGLRIGNLGWFYADTDDFNGTEPRKFDFAAGPDGIIGSRDDVRGKNRSLLLNDADNNPFNAPAGVVDRTTYQLDRNDGFFPHVPWATVSGAAKDKTGFDPIANLEAVMMQGRADRTKRGITWDDRVGIRYLETGLDQLAGTNDDYSFSFVFKPEGVNSPDNQIPAGVNILISQNKDLKVLGENAPNRAGQNGIVGSIVEYELDLETDALLAETAIWLDGPLDSLGTSVVFVDITIIPEPSTLLFLFTASALGILAWRLSKH